MSLISILLNSPPHLQTVIVPSYPPPGSSHRATFPPLSPPDMFSSVLLKACFRSHLGVQRSRGASQVLAQGALATTPLTVPCRPRPNKRPGQLFILPTDRAGSKSQGCVSVLRKGTPTGSEGRRATGSLAIPSVRRRKAANLHQLLQRLKSRLSRPAP